jgi:hypothetical protein
MAGVVRVRGGGELDEEGLMDQSADIAKSFVDSGMRWVESYTAGEECVSSCSSDEDVECVFVACIV